MSFRLKIIGMAPRRVFNVLSINSSLVELPSFSMIASLKKQNGTLFRRPIWGTVFLFGMSVTVFQLKPCHTACAFLGLPDCLFIATAWPFSMHIFALPKRRRIVLSSLPVCSISRPLPRKARTASASEDAFLK